MLEPDTIVHIDYKQYRVVISNPSYVGLELVENPKLKRTIRIKDFPHLCQKQKTC